MKLGEKPAAKAAMLSIGALLICTSTPTGAQICNHEPCSTRQPIHIPPIKLPTMSAMDAGAHRINADRVLRARFNDAFAHNDQTQMAAIFKSAGVTVPTGTLFEREPNTPTVPLREYCLMLVAGGEWQTKPDGTGHIIKVKEVPCP